MSRSDGKATNPQTKQIGSFAADAARDMNLGFEPVQTFIRDGSRVAAFKAGVTELLTKEFLGTEAPAPAAASSVWTLNRTIQIGTCKNEQAMRAALKAAGRRVGSWASNMLPQVKYSPEVRTINLVWPGVDELGLAEFVSVGEVHNRGLELGLELCEWEDGPQLAAQYIDQPDGEEIYMAMKPIVGPAVDYSDEPYGDGEMIVTWLEPIVLSDDFHGLFAVRHSDEERCLHGGYGGLSNWCGGHRRFAFRCK